MFEKLLPEIEKSISGSAGAIPVVFKGMEREFAKENKPGKNNRHDFHELLYIKSGKAKFDIEGRKISLRKGDNLIIRPGISHRVIVDEEKTEMIILYFDFMKNAKAGKSDFQLNKSDVSSLTIEDFLQFAKGEEEPFREGTTIKSCLMVKGKTKRDIANILERILGEHKGNAYGREIMMQFLAMELLVNLSRGLREDWEESLRVRDGKVKELVKIGQKYLAENHEVNICISDAAEYVFLSSGYFTRVFKEETGMSPMNFLMQVRINHACEMLEKRDIKVGAIARAVGFASPQRLNAAFKKYMGTTPMEYRKSITKSKAEE